MSVSSAAASVACRVGGCCERQRECHTSGKTVVFKFQSAANRLVRTPLPCWLILVKTCGKTQLRCYLPHTFLHHAPLTSPDHALPACQSTLRGGCTVCCSVLCSPSARRRLACRGGAGPHGQL